MEVAAIELRAISFDSIPTGSQLSDALNDVHKFLSRVGGILTVDGSLTAANREVANILNASNLIKEAADICGRNTSGLVLPMPSPGQVSR